LQKLQSVATLFAKVILLGCDGFAQTASTYVWKQATITFTNFSGGSLKDPLSGSSSCPGRPGGMWSTAGNLRAGIVPGITGLFISARKKTR
jgi:hypothetical protein